jgi:DNA-binding MarR family transcriptional regulator
MAQDNTIDYYLKAAWQSVVNAYNQEASKFGITRATGYVLINIKKEGTAVSQIANLLGVRSTSLSRILSNMEKQGLIYREADAQDKRSVKVFLTGLGIEKRILAVHVVKDFNEYLIQNFSERERIRMAEILKKINKLAQQYALEKK